MDRQPPTYPPLDTLKPVTDGLWIVDGPIIRFGPPLLRLRFPTRMTLVRLASGDLFVHSPTRLTPSLRREIERVGTPRFLIAPNRLHYWWIGEWQRAWPAAQSYLAPRVPEQARGRIDFPWRPLEGAAGYAWDADIETLPVVGSYMTEFAFFHRSSRTLVLTDLIENFEPRKLSLAMRWLAWLGGVRHPDGQTPRDLRLTFAANRVAMRAAVERMIALDPARVIIAHGRWYERDGAAELTRAFRWLRAS